VLLCVGSLNLSAVVEAQHTRGLATLIGLPQLTILNWYVWPLFPMFVIFYVSALAETNRPPFDLVEAESELVAGFMTEYGSTPYLLFMLGEYVAITTMCALATILFLGGWLSPIPFAPFTWVPGVIWFVLKLFFMFFLIAMAKAIVPRYRYDQLMRLGWKVFLPLSLAMVVIVAGVLQFAGPASRIRSSQGPAATTEASFGFERTLANNDSRAALDRKSADGVRPEDHADLRSAALGPK